MMIIINVMCHMQRRNYMYYRSSWNNAVTKKYSDGTEKKIFDSY